MVKIEFETGNEAFQSDGNFGFEIAIILRKIAANVDSGTTYPDGMPVMDTNGNRVGTVIIVDD